jgi:hypothetical protein
MTSLTGVEIGPESCVVIHARPLPGWDLGLSFAHRLEYPEAALRDGRFAKALDDVRRSAELPRQLCAVSWLTENAHDLLTDAGFDVKSVISPPQALALLAPRTTRATGDGVAWLALNRDRAAFSIVCGSRLLFTRTFDWTVARAPLPDSAHASLLRRYLYVSQLAPELQQAIKTVKTRYGIRVGSAVTCGDMPDLRSLAMPLIEELDLEVETLDSTAGLTLAGEPLGRSLLEAAPALRLACAAIDAPLPAPWAMPSPQLIRRAAAVFSVALLASAGWTAAPNRTGMPAPPPAAIHAPGGPAIITPLSVESASPPEVTAAAASASSPSVTPSITRAAPGFAIPTPAATSGSFVPRARAGRGFAAMGSTVVARATERPVAPEGFSSVHPPAVDLILTGSVRNVALVDGRFVEVGDAVGDLQIVTIDPDAVVLRDREGAVIRVPSASADGPIARRGRGTTGPSQP